MKPKNITPSWDKLAKIGQSKIVTLTIFVPILGYMIIFNDNFIKLLALSNEIFPNEAASGLSLSDSEKTRLFYFYFGLSFLGIASSLYQLFCPTIIKESLTISKFIATEINLITQNRFDGIVNYLKTNIHPIYKEKFTKLILNKIEDIKLSGLSLGAGESPEVKELRIDLALMLWQHKNWSSPITRFAAFIFYIIGFLILSIPTIETFINVVKAAST